MKKIFLALALMMGGLSFTACDDEVDTSEGIVDTHPAQSMTGKTYTGTWYKQPSGSDVVTEIPGTLSFVGAADNYVATISVDIQGETLTVNTANVNVVCTAQKGVIFTNTVAGQIGAAGISGSIVDGKAECAFSASVKDGRKTIITDFTFVGQ